MAESYCSRPHLYRKGCPCMEHVHTKPAQGRRRRVKPWLNLSDLEKQAVLHACQTEYPVISSENPASRCKTVFDAALRSGTDRSKDSRQLRMELEAGQLLRKYNPRDCVTSIEREDAYAKWVDYDRRLASVNLMFQNVTYLDNVQKCVLYRAKALVEEVLGRAPTYTEVALASSHGPKSTLEHADGWFAEEKKYETLLFDPKYYLNKDLTSYLRALLHCNDRLKREAIKLLNPWSLRLLPDTITGLGSVEQLLLASRSQIAHQGNRFSAVPKTADSVRPICVEATSHMFFQRGLGFLIRQRLKTVGIDLDLQFRVHEKLVQHHSDQICTIDLSSASDSISLELVRFLVPNDWFQHLSRLRAETTKFRGNLHTLQKISSMGNGFTFELETLLFYCISEASRQVNCLDSVLPQAAFVGVSPHIRQIGVTVFGDDIIAPIDSYNPILEVLELCGFSINIEKTHGPDSRIKESCGYFSIDNEGFDLVTIKSLKSLPDLVSVRNRLFLRRDRYRGLFLKINNILKEAFGNRDLLIKEFYSVSTTLPEFAVVYVTDCKASSVSKYFAPRMSRKKSKSRLNLLLAVRDGTRADLVKSWSLRWTVKHQR